MKSEQRTWEKMGQIAPYYSVLAAEKFRPENLSAENLSAFFASGREHVTRLMQAVRELNPQFRPQTAIDFGCGVGRVAIPLAEISAKVLAIDISGKMLEEAGKNCAGRGANNVTFMTTAEFLRLPDASANFVHSFIVLQHIRPAKGYRAMGKLISILEEGGMGALHVSFRDDRPRLRRLLSGIKRTIPGVAQLHNLVRGLPASYPAMEMHGYRLDKIFHMLHHGGCRKVLSHFSEHGAHLGVFLIFEKSAQKSW